MCGAAKIGTGKMDQQIGFGQLVGRGLKRHCPQCDAPTLFAGYLKVEATCAKCGADNGQHRVDDIASYATVLLVGHIIVAPLLAIPAFWYMPLWASMSVIMLLVGLATLAALPFIKGGVIGALRAAARKKPA
jgi:uncharacterized protein (DUF983 family)